MVAGSLIAKYVALGGRSETVAVEERGVSRAASTPSPFGISLRADQQRELSRRAAAYSGPWREVVRAKAVLLAAEGLSNAEIAGRLGVSRQAVSQWRKRFF